MKELDRNLFNKKVQATCLNVKSKDLTSILKLVKGYLLKVQNFRPIVKIDNIRSLIHLNPDKSEELIKNEKFLKLVEDYKIEFENRILTLGYDNFSSHEILNSLLNEIKLGLSSYSVIGHIIHLNLRDEYEPYKKVIGQVLLDKNPQQSLVLNKLAKIDSTFRYFEFDILAKRDKSVSTIVQVNENGFKFKMDFAKVYWNPRLSTEHARVIDLINENEIVYDVFAGIGPFAIPACKKNCIVLANDLNPESYKYLNENVKLNKVTGISTYNLDGRKFITEVIGNDLIQNWIKMLNSDKKTIKKFHIIMNLPAIAIEFLDAFIDLAVNKIDDQNIDKLYQSEIIMPTIYCYCFHQVGLDKSEMVKKVKKQIDYELINQEIFFIRKVAPAKDMYRLTFKIPKDVLFASKLRKKRRIS